MKTLVLSAFVVCCLVMPIHAVIIQFDLIGTAGNGLLAGNETGVSGGTGGEIGAGITFNDVTLILSINVGWGSGNGFSNLTSAVNNQHIHGPTPSNYGNGYTETAGVAIGLTNISGSAINGTIIQSVTLTAAQKTNLYNGKYYINVHTANNGSGEIRGFLVAKPQANLSITGQGGSAQAKILVSGFTGQKHIIQASSNLVNWSPVVTNTTGTNLFQFTENNPLQFPQRFYRAVVVP